MSEIMKGERIESPFAAGGGLVGEWPKAGDFFFYPEQGWCAVTPDGRMANLSKRVVTEHDDRTITVSPSILVNGGSVSSAWHGYLERGIWREC